MTLKRNEEVITLIKANCDAGEISEYLGLGVEAVRKEIIRYRNAQRSAEYYHAKKAGLR